MKLRDLRSRSIELLHRGGVEAARTCVDWLIEHVLGISPVEALSYPDREVSAEGEKEVLRGVTRRLSGEPIQYIVGWTEFYGLKISVSPSVLIPRPETEIVVEAVLELAGPLPRCHILDVGTGSGCIALAVASELTRARVVGCDVSEGALVVARDNALRLDLDVSFVAADVEDPVSMNVCGTAFNVIASNPPYIPESEVRSLPREVIGYEPRGALISAKDPFRYYRALMTQARARVVDGGWLVAEIHSGFADEVTQIATEHGLSNVEVRPDLAGLPRVLVGRCK